MLIFQFNWFPICLYIEKWSTPLNELLNYSILFNWNLIFKIRLALRDRTEIKNDFFFDAPNFNKIYIKLKVMIPPIQICIPIWRRSSGLEDMARQSPNFVADFTMQAFFKNGPTYSKIIKINNFWAYSVDITLNNNFASFDFYFW